VAEGGYRLAEHYGHAELYMGSKKMAFAAYDPRAMKGMGLEYATSNRGACHMRGATTPWEVRGAGGPYTYEDKAPALKFLQDATTVGDAAGICMFHTRGQTWEHQAEVLCPLIETVTGVGYDVDEVLLIGEKIWNLERLFNLKAGITKADDTLPPRMLEEPIPEGPAKGQVHELHLMLPEYYQARGWDEEGVPTSEKLEELGLS
jgi:aldehyde:ferredoxin oxidoreductase